MSRTEKGSVAPGTDWWSRRPFSARIGKGTRATAWFKRKTHKIERRAGKPNPWPDDVPSEME